MRPVERAARWRLRFALIAIAICLGESTPVLAYHLPKWEAGFGLGTVRTPPYRGALTAESYWIPFPYLRYRGERLQIDDDIRAGLLKTDSLKLDFAIAGNVPVRNDKDGQRAGMQGLDPVLEIGPTLGWRIARDVESTSSVWLHVPWRPVVSMGSPWLAYRGWVVAPYLEFNRAVRAGALWRFSLSAGPMYGSAGYHNYFYEVTADQATARRAEYHSDGGYSGSRVTLSLVRNSARMWAGAFARYDDMRGAAFVDSPLVQSRHYWVFGVTAAWVFVHSDVTIAH